MYGRDSRQGDGAGLRVADHHHALCLPELDAVHRHPGRGHGELHAASRRLVARLLHDTTTSFVPKLGRKLVDRRDRRRRRNVARERREVHGSYLKTRTFSRLRALATR